MLRRRASPAVLPVITMPTNYHPRNHAASAPHKTAYVIAETGERKTYAELNDDSARIARVLRDLGCGVGSGVAFLLENRAGFFEICWAAQRAGLHYTPVSTHLKVEEVAYIVGDCGASVFIISARFSELATRLARVLPRDTVLLSLGGNIDGYRALEPLLASAQASAPADETTGSSMLYSSGTTGHPKGVRHALNGDPIDHITPRAEAFRDRYRLSSETIYLSPAPLYHAAPLGFTMATLAWGGTVIVMQRFDAERALAFIEQYRVSHSQWVPTMFIRMLRLPEETRHGYDLSSHRVAIHAAAPCPIETKRQMIDWWGLIVVEYYSGSEGVGTTYINAEEWLKKPGSVGRTVAGELHILDEDGAELAAGEVGAVYFGDAPPFHYHNAPEKTSKAFTADGWGTLGDVGYVDEDGYLFLTDRKANMIISGGVNIYPQETENLLLGHDAVLDAAVFGVPNEDYGEEVKAVVQLAAGQQASPGLEQALIDYCRERMSSIKCPRSIDFERELPRLPNGKLYKRELKARYQVKR